MKGLVYISILLLIPLVLQAQEKERAFEYARAFSVNQKAETTEWFAKLTSRFDRTKAKTDEQFVRKLFYKVHNRYLKKYDEYTAFDQLVKNRTYDCLTGTALYALLFEYYGIPYQIHEEPFHINLSVELDGETFIVESTDPMHGFQKVSDMEDTDLGLGELNGLLLYNQAVKFNNTQQFQQAFQAVAHAEQLYPSTRINEERKVIEQNLILSVASSFR